MLYFTTADVPLSWDWCPDSVGKFCFGLRLPSLIICSTKNVTKKDTYPF